MTNNTKNMTTTTTLLLLVAVVLSSLAVISDAFLAAPAATTTTIPPQSLASRSLSSSSLSSSSGGDARTITVISPPGGLGEMSAIESARLGGRVRWFVVSRPPPSSSSPISSSTTTTTTTTAVSLASGTIEAIRKSGGSLEFAGAHADDLVENRGGALAALGSWCHGSSAVLCTYDGAAAATTTVRSAAPGGDNASADSDVVGTAVVRAGIRLAAREATGGMMGDDTNDASAVAIVAILAAGEEPEGEEEGEAGVVGGGVLGGLGSMLFAGLAGGGGKEDGSKSTTMTAPPRTLKEAVTGGGRGGAATVIRYGELFGAPESSPESSHFMGGPRRDPIVRDMYSMRSVRIDPAVVTTSSSVGEGGGGGGGGGGMGYRSNRLAVAEAASRLGLGRIPAVVAGEDGASAAPTTVEVSLSSFPGTEGPTDAEWDAEFRRVVSESSTSRSGRLSPSLFRAEFSSVPSPTRLAEWLATKWAPAVLRSYDIAGIRVGARPVYASVLTRDDGGDGDVAVVEIVWQELVNFLPVTSGRMYVEVGRSGMTATRGPGDASAGFGVPSASSLPGEDILVRRLADASSQAVEKGLAIKALSTKKVEMASKRPVTTVVGAPPADDTSPVVISSLTPDVVPSSSESSGPRNAGARKSPERTRGSRKPASTPSSLTESGGE